MSVKVRVCVIVCVFLIALGSVFAFAAPIDYPKFPGFPQGMEYAAENDIPPQWIHNTPYGGITVGSNSAGIVLGIQRVNWLSGQVQYDFSVTNMLSSVLSDVVIIIPFSTGDFDFPSYVFSYDVTCSAPSYQVSRGGWTASSRNYSWATDYYSDGIGSYISNGDWSVSDCLAIRFASVPAVTTYNVSVNFGLYRNPYYVEPSSLPNGDLGFWQLGSSTNLEAVNSVLSEIGQGIVNPLIVFSQFFNSSAYLMLALWVVVILNVVDIVLSWVNNL